MVDAFVPATERQQVVMDSTFTRLNVSAMAPSYTTSTGFLSFTAFSTDEKGRCLSFHSFSLPVPPLAHLCCCKAVPIIVLERSTALLYDCLQPETHTPQKKKKEKKPLVITLCVHQGYDLNIQKRSMHAAGVILVREGGGKRERERERERERDGKGSATKIANST